MGIKLSQIILIYRTVFKYFISVFKCSTSLSLHFSRSYFVSSHLTSTIRVVQSYNMVMKLVQWMRHQLICTLNSMHFYCMLCATIAGQNASGGRTKQPDVFLFFFLFLPVSLLGIYLKWSQNYLPIIYLLFSCALL